MQSLHPRRSFILKKLDPDQQGISGEHTTKYYPVQTLIAMTLGNPGLAQFEWGGQYLLDM